MPYTVNDGKLNTGTRSDYRDSGNSDRNNTSNYSQANEDAIERAANRASSRTLNDARQFSQLAQQTGGENFSRDMQKNREDQAFKASQSDLDRKKSADEFTQNANRDLLKLQVDGNNKRGDVAVEATKAYRDQGFKDISDANAAKYQKDLAQTNIAGQRDLANIAQQTAFGEQKSSIERAKESARAQVTSALYGSSRQYQGY
jgi:hypothetical protein